MILNILFEAIRQEIRDIQEGLMDRTNNPLKVNQQFFFLDVQAV